ncbi:MAG: 1-deoxy-D-xylulose-5-phosphate reductoisomerase [Dehalococcoidia bacterium]|nr:1-deoxy-D-xylulose-5-phosphate reductoisomerase [Dehalococcoidia bacterium]
MTPIKLVILGCTGSIGQQTLEVVRAHPDKLQVLGLAGGNNLKLLASQIAEFHPRYVYCLSKNADSLPGDYIFMEREEMVSLDEATIIVAASSGASGLKPVLSAIQAGKIIALANKETLVSAGSVIMPLAQKHNAQIRTIDSEHSAIWQCLTGEKSLPSRLILTASGGPFRSYSPIELLSVKAEQALKHPSWKMGAKITVDCATLTNKGLEVIEAHWLFGMPFEQIDVLVHPQSIIHSMVEFCDGTIKAQLGTADMRIPIQYALSHPHRWDNPSLPRLDLMKNNLLSFEEPDYTRFPCLKLAIDAGKKGGTFPAVLCAADETAVDLFLSGRIEFNYIPSLIEKALARHKNICCPSIDDIISVDKETRAIIQNNV